MQKLAQRCLRGEARAVAAKAPQITLNPKISRQLQRALCFFKAGQP